MDEDKLAARMHGFCFSDSESESSGERNSESDDELNALRPPPVPIKEEDIVTVPVRGVCTTTVSNKSENENLKYSRNSDTEKIKNVFTPLYAEVAKYNLIHKKRKKKKKNAQNMQSINSTIAVNNTKDKAIETISSQQKQNLYAKKKVSQYRKDWNTNQNEVDLNALKPPTIPIKKEDVIAVPVRNVFTTTVHHKSENENSKCSRNSDAKKIQNVFTPLNAEVDKCNLVSKKRQNRKWNKKETQNMQNINLTVANNWKCNRIEKISSQQKENLYTKKKVSHIQYQKDRITNQNEIKLNALKPPPMPIKKEAVSVRNVCTTTIHHKSENENSKCSRNTDAKKIQNIFTPLNAEVDKCNPVSKKQQNRRWKKKETQNMQNINSTVANNWKRNGIGKISSQQKEVELNALRPPPTPIKKEGVVAVPVRNVCTTTISNKSENENSKCSRNSDTQKIKNVFTPLCAEVDKYNLVQKKQKKRKKKKKNAQNMQSINSTIAVNNTKDNAIETISLQQKQNLYAKKKVSHVQYQKDCITNQDADYTNGDKYPTSQQGYRHSDGSEISSHIHETAPRRERYTCPAAHQPPFNRRPVTRNSNILSAVLCLVKELDYPSLEVVEMAVRCRMDELEE